MSLGRLSAQEGRLPCRDLATRTLGLTGSAGKVTGEVRGDRVDAALDERETSIPFRWLTFEAAIYGLILLAGLGVRLAALGRCPLLETGANTALAAWRTLQGSPWRPTYYLPLLYDANLAVFGLIRATDAAARLLPAIVGSALVIAPYFARDVLGRKGALVASLLLAFSPTWVFFSRTADGSILTAAASTVILLSVRHYVRSRRALDLRLGAVALGLGLTAGPGMYTMVASALVCGLVWWVRWRGDPQAVQARELVRAAGTRTNLILLVGVFLFFAGGFSFNPAGIGASVELGARWARDLRPTSSGLPWSALPKTLLTYESLTVVVALLSVAWGLRQRDVTDAFLASWAALALVLAALLGHREPMWLTDVLLPLVILAARGFQRLWDHLAPDATASDGVAVLLGLALLAFAFLGVASYTHTGQAEYLSRARLGCGVLVAAWGAYWFWAQRDSALRVGAVLVMVLMLGPSVRGTTAVAFQTGRDPREGLVHRPASTQLSDLSSLLCGLSSRQAGDPWLLDIDYEEALDPWMGWYLRDYPKARSMASVDGRSEARALVTRVRPKEARIGGYAAQRFRLHEMWTEEGVSVRERLRWLLYRDAVGSEQTTEMELWVRLPSGSGES